MRQANKTKFSRLRKRRGFVLVLMAIAAMALLGSVGVAVDIGRLFIAKNEVQSFCDAGALAAARELNGTSAGFTSASSAVSGLSGKWNFGSQTISGYTIDYATSANGPWSTAPSTAVGYTHARVNATVNLPMYFLPIATSVTNQNVAAQAAAGQVPQTSLSQGLEPYTVVSIDENATNWGLTVGNTYDIQWPQFNGNRHGCTNGNPENCFVSPPCANETSGQMKDVKNYWSSSYNGYWGSNSNNVIRQQVLNQMQLNPAPIGSYLTMTNGNKASQAMVLDERTNQDGDHVSTTLAAYRASSGHNGRRLLSIPVVKPSSSGTLVVGYAAMLLSTDSTSASVDSGFYKAVKGNEPFCAQYAGPYVLGSRDPGGSSGGGFFKLGLVQ